MMNIATEDMRSCIQEWYAQAQTYEELFEIHYAVRSECDKQSVYMAHTIAKEGADNAAD